MLGDKPLASAMIFFTGHEDRGKYCPGDLWVWVWVELSLWGLSLSHHNLSKTRLWQIHHHPQTHNNTSNKNDFLVFIAGLHQIQCHHANSVACPHFFFLLILLIFSSFPLYYYTHHSDANLTPPNMDLMTLDPIRPTNCCTSLDNLYRKPSIICGESDFVLLCLLCVNLIVNSHYSFNILTCECALLCHDKLNVKFLKTKYKYNIYYINSEVTVLSLISKRFIRVY